MQIVLEWIVDGTLNMLGDTLQEKAHRAAKPALSRTRTRLRAWATRTFGDHVVREMERPRTLALPRGQR